MPVITIGSTRRGRLWPGLTGLEEVIDGLRRAEARLAADRPLLAWGFDPIFLPGRRLDRSDLDRVSQTRPIAVIHSNFHLMTVNSTALALAQFDRETAVEGVAKDDSGEPNGELQEFAAMFPVMRRLGIDFRDLAQSSDSIRGYGAVARRAGVTTVTDLFNDLPDEDVAQLVQVTGEKDYPVRLVPALSAHGGSPEDIAERALALRQQSSEKLRLGAVKIITDGSIQGFTARLRWPGYYKGPDHGIWNIAPEQIMAAVDHLHARGVQMHIHVNGDEASEVAIEAVDQALARHPWRDHRHVLQHCQMADGAQYRRMAALGLCANLFANHVFYFGDQHYEITLGPDRAERIDACASALAAGVPLAIHSDAPVTPMGPLITAWCAANRQTASGRVLGDSERISVEAALQAVTLGPAYTLRMDHEVGSIEVGKRADFAVLEDDPLAVEPEALKDIAVWGTVLGGQVQPVDG